MQKLRDKLACTTAMAGMACLLASVPAVAQLDEIVVTAQKREQSLTDVPISVTVIGGQQIEDAGLETVIDLPQLVPGLRIDLAGAFAQPTVRGVGSAIAAAGFNSNVPTYVDGFYAPSQLTTDMKLLSLESVQVAKGPQGTLYGRNATGGAILLSSREPSYDPVLEVNTSYARFNRREVSAYGSYGLSEKLAVDVTGFYEAGKGFLNNIATGADNDGAFEQWAVRTSVLFEPNEWITAKFAYSHAERDDPTPVAAGNFNGLSAGTALNNIGIPTTVASGYGDVSNDSATSFTSDHDAYQLTVELDLGWANFVSYTQYREESSKSVLDLDGSASASGVPLFAVSFPINNRTVTQEVNLSGIFKERLDWLVGAYYLNFDEDYTNFQAQAPGFGLLFPTTLYNVGANNLAYAGFADVTYEFADRWYLTGGVRYNVDATRAFFNVQPIGSLLLGVAPGRTDVSEWFHEVTTRGVLRYEPTESSSIYFSYTEGYKAGALTPSAFVTTPLEPEEIKAYEGGFKWAGNRNRVEAAVFYYDYKNIQLATYNGLQALVNNAAEASVIGGEIQLNSSITDELSVTVGLSYTDSEYDSFPNAQQFVQDLNPLSPTFSTFLTPFIDASGFDVQRAPDFTGNITVNYERTFGFGTINLDGNYYYSSSFFFDVANQFEQDGFGILNLRAAWTDPSDHWTIAAFGKNVLNEEYLTQVLPGLVAIQQTFGEPATGGVTISYKY